MKLRPILFNTDMVVAQKNGWKDVTRRMRGLEKINENPDDWQWEFYDYSLERGWVFTQKSTVSERTLADRSFHQEAIKCPYGEVGDVLWVRETWKPGAWREDGRVAVDYKASPELTQTPWVNWPNFEKAWPKWTDELLANGSVPDANGVHRWEPGKSPMRWRPSIHMPLAACRTFLQITSIRVERLHDITEAGAYREGLYYKAVPTLYPSALVWFRQLFESINPGSVIKNPWVWVIQFMEITEREAGL